MYSNQGYSTYITLKTAKLREQQLEEIVLLQDDKVDLVNLLFLSEPLRIEPQHIWDCVNYHSLATTLKAWFIYSK